jgi:hypothetical protein
MALALDDDRQRQTLEIQALERALAGRLARTPYALLLSFPGRHVVSAADVAGAMGPIGHYAKARAITGRAGLYPSRYQSDQVAIIQGPRVRCAHRRLRAAIVNVAANLMLGNRHFHGRAQTWRAAGTDPRLTQGKIAGRFCRSAFPLVAGGHVVRHPAVQHRSYVLDTLLAFQRAHDTSIAQVMAARQAAIAQLPKSADAAEARPLTEQGQEIQHGRRRGPQPLGAIVPIVWARLGVPVLPSPGSGVVDPTSSAGRPEPQTP